MEDLSWRQRFNVVPESELNVECLLGTPTPTDKPYYAGSCIIYALGFDAL